MNDNDNLLRSSILDFGRPQRPSPSSLSDFLTDQPTPPISPPLSNFLPSPINQNPSTLSAIASRYLDLLSQPSPTTARIPLRSPQKQAESLLRSELAEIIKDDLNLTLARVIPTLDDLAFADGKEIDMAVLYIDIRDSSSITSSHIAENAAKIYKIFHKAMAFAGKKYGGKIGGIAGDSMMLVFPFNPTKTPRKNAVLTAFYMQYLLGQIVNPLLNNERFSHSLSCGIGIDFGKVLVVRVGQRGDGNNERLWTGDPANYASQLSDLDSGIYISKDVYDGLIDTSLKSGNRSWISHPDKEGKICYKYAGTYERI